MFFSRTEIDFRSGVLLAHTALVLGPGTKQRPTGLQEYVSDAGRTVRKLLLEPGEKMASIMKWQEV